MQWTIYHIEVLSSFVVALFCKHSKFLLCEWKKTSFYPLHELSFFFTLFIRKRMEKELSNKWETFPSTKLLLISVIVIFFFSFSFKGTTQKGKEKQSAGNNLSISNSFVVLFSLVAVKMDVIMLNIVEFGMRSGFWGWELKLNYLRKYLFWNKSTKKFKFWKSAGNYLSKILIIKNFQIFERS